MEGNNIGLYFIISLVTVSLTGSWLASMIVCALVAVIIGYHNAQGGGK